MLIYIITSFIAATVSVYGALKAKEALIKYRTERDLYRPMRKGINLWLARDPNGNLYGYNGKPVRKKSGHFIDETSWGGCCVFDKKLFPEVTNENSPKQITILC